MRNGKHLRTFDGLEVDLFLVKGDKVNPQDARHLERIESVSGIKHILKFVIYEGTEIVKLKEGVWGVPAIMFFGPGGV